MRQFQPCTTADARGRPDAFEGIVQSGSSVADMFNVDVAFGSRRNWTSFTPLVTDRPHTSSGSLVGEADCQIRNEPGSPESERMNRPGRSTSVRSWARLNTFTATGMQNPCLRGALSLAPIGKSAERKFQKIRPLADLSHSASTSRPVQRVGNSHICGFGIQRGGLPFRTNIGTFMA